MGAFPSQGLCLQSWANCGTYRLEADTGVGRSGLARHREHCAPPSRAEAGLGALAPANRSSYLLELLVDDFVNLV